MIAVAGWYTDEVSFQGTPCAISHEFMGFLKYVCQLIEKAFTAQTIAHLSHNIRRIFSSNWITPQNSIQIFIFLDKFVKALAFEKKSRNLQKYLEIVEVFYAGDKSLIDVPPCRIILARQELLLFGFDIPTLTLFFLVELDSCGCGCFIFLWFALI